MTAAADKAPARTPLAGAAAAFLGAVAILAVAAAAPALLALELDGRDLALFLVLGASAASAQLLVVEIRRNYGFPLALTFVVAGVFLLPAGLVALLAVAMHLPDALRRRSPWYIHAFNTSNYTLVALVVWFGMHAVTDVGDPTRAAWAIAGCVACAVFVALNHVLLATMLRLARGHRFRDSGLFTVASLGPDFALAAVGLGVAALAHESALIAVVAATPLLLADRLFRLMASFPQPLPDVRRAESPAA